MDDQEQIANIMRRLAAIESEITKSRMPVIQASHLGLPEGWQDRIVPQGDLSSPVFYDGKWHYSQHTLTAAKKANGDA